MPAKAQVAAAGPIEDRHEDMEFRIEGLELVDARDGIFRLKNVPTVNIAWPKVMDVLTDAGISPHDAERYVDGLADEVGQDQIAKIFAQRAKRIG